MRDSNSQFPIPNSKLCSWNFGLGAWNLNLSLWFLVLVLLSSCSYHLKTEEEAERELMLRNKVKSITELTTPVRVSLDAEEYISKETIFDQNGFKRKVVNHNADGSIESTVTCGYDKNNNLILTQGANSDKTSFKETRSYDNHNNRIDLYHYLSDGSYKYRNRASYDSKGRMIELDWYWPTGLSAKRFYVYDGENMKEESEYSPQGQLLYKWKYKQDANNNLIEAVQYKPDSTILSKKVFFYSNVNQLIKRIFYSGESIQNSQTYEYNKNGLMSAKNDFNPFGKVSVKYRYQYEYFQ
ncbi:MAG: hypothetical protein HY840_13285 [Bacteroidetes bacterium]|nr:hypothetical protein [Bacteroidota bacterium]